MVTRTARATSSPALDERLEHLAGQLRAVYVAAFLPAQEEPRCGHTGGPFGDSSVCTEPPRHQGDHSNGWLSWIGPVPRGIDPPQRFKQARD